MDSILFLSSPAQSLAVTPPHVQTVPMSSSPSLPSPSQLFTIKATTIPCTRLEESNGGDVITGFTSAADLLRQVRKSEMRLDCLSEEKEGLGVYADFESRESENIIVKELATKENDHLMVKKAKGSRKSSTKSGKKTTGGDENWSKPEELILSEPQADKKKRSKRSKEETQTKIKKGGITKPAINKSTRKRTKLVKSKATSGHETKPIVDTIEQTITYAPGEEPLDLALVEAIKRRRAWTPVKDTLQKSSRSSEASAKILPDSEGSSAILDVSKGDNLFGEYKYAQKADDRSVGFENARSMNREVLVKRRKLDMINCRTAPAVQPKKLKLPKKKAQTITEKATAPFANDDSTTPSILEYFETSDTEKDRNSITEERVSEVPSSKVTGRKPRMKDVNKSSKAKTQKGPQKPAILNSPETAIKYTEHQDLVFGTSSQLMRDESPTLIKDIQEALKASESMTLNSNKFSSDTPFNICERSAVSSYTASKNLWSVAARDLDGSLLDTEVVNLVDTPMPPKFAAPEKAISRESKSMQLEKESNDDIKISDGSSHHFQRPQIHGINGSAQETNPIPEQSIPRSVAEASLKDRRIGRSPAKKRKAPKDSSAVISTLQDQMPNYAGLTTAELSKTITTYGFKAIKKRNEMIALLERCWESQSRIVLQTLPTNVTLPLPFAKERSSREPSKSSSPAKKPRRPSKPIPIQAVVPNLVTTHELDDSTTTPKPRGRPRKKLVPTTSEAAHPPHLTALNPSPPPPPPSLPSPHSIHASIHKAITTYPPTHSPTQPSFHERMLLYEPIVIEDLTTWLNTEGLGTVGVDEEVSSTLVKEWCMDMGVCCFWRADGRRR